MDSDRVVRFGLRGSSDIVGVFIGGYILCFEVKTGRAKQTKEQYAFEQMIDRFGGFYFVVRSAADAVNILDGLKFYIDLRNK